ncbi:MAG TPA: tetratricopeptide repeat protein, partial [Minicystis sp.]|nr:tetratricopeptide repeat protein [Minicystis sp.]
ALELARRCGRIERFVEAIESLVEASRDRDESVDLLVALGAALEADAHDDRRAADAYARAEASLAADDARRGAIWRALERVFERLGDRDAQADVLVKRIDASEGLPPGERADPLYRLAALRLADESTQADAFDLLERALFVSPDAERATVVLRAALERTPDSARLLRFVERFAREHGDRRALVDVLLALGERASRGVLALGPAEEPLREAVDVALSLEDRPLAERILRRVLEGDGDEGARAWAMIALAHLAEDAGDLAEATLLRERAASHFDAEEERQLLLGVAAAAAGPLGDLDRAVRIYETLRAREPADREIWGPLLDAYRRRGDEERLATLLEATAPLVDDNKERAALGLERAKIIAARDERAAAALLADVLEDDASLVEAAMLLSTMLEKAGQTDELAALLARQLEAAKDREDVPSIVSLSMRLGALLEQQGSEQEALDVYHAALDWDKAARDVLRAVLRLAFQRDDSMDLGDALEQMLAIEVGDEAVELALQLAELRASHGDPAGAEKALEQGFSSCPTSDRLREELAQRYLAREAFKKLADLHLRDAEARTSPAEKVEALCRAADVLRQRSRDAAAAAEILRRALEVDPRDRDVLMALLDAYGELGQHDRAVEAVSAALGVDPEDAWLYRARASLYEALGKDQLALVDLERAYEKSGGGYASELVQQLERAVAWCAESQAPETRLAEKGLRLRAAEVLLRAGEIDRARAHLADLVRRDPKDKGALRRLAELETRAERWDAVSATFRRLLAIEDGDALVEVALKLAEACERDGRLADARGGLERALRVAPDNAELRDRLR